MPTASGPSASISAFIRVAMSVMASSHVASTQVSPTRRMGLRILRGCSTSWLAVLPLAQKSCQVWGFCLSAEILVTRLSSTVTSRPHEARQYRQNVCTVLVLIGDIVPDLLDRHPPLSATLLSPARRRKVAQIRSKQCDLRSPADAWAQLAGRNLGLCHRPILAPPRQQFGVTAALDDPALLHHQDLVGVADGREPVGDDEAGPVAAEFDHRVLDEQFGSGVHRTRRLVEDQQLRAGQKRAG